MKDDVRLLYCKLWQSIIEFDQEGIKKYTQELGCGEYYGLLTCIVTGRSWNAIQGGIGNKHQTAAEVRIFYALDLLLLVLNTYPVILLVLRLIFQAPNQKRKIKLF